MENMTKITIEEKIPGKSADDVYETFNSVFEEVGFEIWKKRPIAWLCMAKTSIDSKPVDANLVVRPTSPVSLTLIMSSPTATEEDMSALAEILFERFNAK